MPTTSSPLQHQPRYISADVKIIDKSAIKNSIIELSEDGSSSVNVLASLFGGDHAAANHFLSSDFQKRPVVIRGSVKRLQYLKSELHDLHVKDMLEDSASDEIQVWLKTDKNDTKTDIDKAAEGLQSFKTPDPGQALKLFQAGHSLYCRAPASLESKLVPNLLTSCKYGVNTKYCGNDRYSRGEIETFYSTPGHITDDHIDFQENFTVQLQGIKKWTFSRSSLTHPIRGCTPHFSATGLEDVVEQQLKVHKLTNLEFRADEFRSGVSDNSCSISNYNDISNNNSSAKGGNKVKADALGVKVKGGKYKSSSDKKRARDDDDQSAVSELNGQEGNNVDDQSGISSCCSVTLYPGDVLYHPAGIWHRVECLPPTAVESASEQASGHDNNSNRNSTKKQKKISAQVQTLIPPSKAYSLAINVSLIAVSYADLACNALQQLLWKDPNYRMAVSASDANGRHNPHEVIERMLRVSLPAILTSLSARDVLPLPCMHRSAGESDPTDLPLRPDATATGSRVAHSNMDSDSDSEDEEEEEEEEEEEDDDNSDDDNSDSDDGDGGSDSGIDSDHEEEEEEEEEEEVEEEEGGCISDKLLVVPNRAADNGLFMVYNRKDKTRYKLNPLAMLINCNAECHGAYNGYFAPSVTQMTSGWGYYSKSDIAGTAPAAGSMLLDQSEVNDLCNACGEDTTSFYLFHDPKQQNKNIKFSVQDCYHIYAIHCSYGSTEELESLCQRRIAVPVTMANALLQKFLWRDHQPPATFTFAEVEKCLMTVDLGDKSNIHIQQLFYYLIQIGLITPLIG